MPGAWGLSPLNRIRLWVYSNKIPIYPMFYLLKGDYTLTILGVMENKMESTGIKGDYIGLYCAHAFLGNPSL